MTVEDDINKAVRVAAYELAQSIYLDAISTLRGDVGTPQNPPYRINFSGDLESSLSVQPNSSGSDEYRISADADYADDVEQGKPSVYMPFFAQGELTEFGVWAKDKGGWSQPNVNAKSLIHPEFGRKSGMFVPHLKHPFLSEDSYAFKHNMDDFENQFANRIRDVLSRMGYVVE